MHLLVSELYCEGLFKSSREMSKIDQKCHKYLLLIFIPIVFLVRDRATGVWKENGNCDQFCLNKVFTKRKLNSASLFGKSRVTAEMLFTDGWKQTV